MMLCCSDILIRIEKEHCHAAVQLCEAAPMNLFYGKIRKFSSLVKKSRQSHPTDEIAKFLITILIFM